MTTMTHQKMEMRSDGSNQSSSSGSTGSEREIASSSSSGGSQGAGSQRETASSSGGASERETEPQRRERWLALVRAGNYGAVKKLLRSGSPPINATDSSGYTALMRCCVSGKLLQVLLDWPECDVNASAAPDGSTALLLAARHRSARTVHALLQRGAVCTRDRLGCSAVHKAASNSDPAVVQLLLDAQADPSARDREGRCPLATSLLQGNAGGALALLAWQRSWAAKVLLRGPAGGGDGGGGAGAAGAPAGARASCGAASSEPGGGGPAAVGAAEGGAAEGGGGQRKL